MKDAYLVLGVSTTASDRVIRQAWRALVLECHPDVCCENRQEQLVAVNEAYNLLRTPEKRAAYDTGRAAVPDPVDIMQRMNEFFEENFKAGKRA